MVALGVIASLIPAMTLQAASAFQFDVWMRAIDKRSVSVQRCIAARDVPAANADAAELERLYGLMERYFAEDYPADDAVKVSHDGRTQAASIPVSMALGDFDAAARSARAIASACNDCHDPYKPFR